MFKGLHCQSAISRGFDDKGVFQKVSKSDERKPRRRGGGPFCESRNLIIGIDSSARPGTTARSDRSVIFCGRTAAARVVSTPQILAGDVSSRISSAMLVRDRRTSSANGAFGRHDRQDSAGMRLVTAASL